MVKPSQADREAAAQHHGWASYQSAALFASNGDMALVDNIAQMLATHRIAALEDAAVHVRKMRGDAVLGDVIAAILALAAKQ